MEALTVNGLSNSDEGKDETDSVKTLEANITYKVVSRWENEIDTSQCAAEKSNESVEDMDGTFAGR